jgi:hypothetical protein
MTGKSEDNNKFSKEPSTSEPKIKTDLSTSAGQLWRDRLNKTKLASQQREHASAPGNIGAANMQNRFGNTSPSNTSRKSKKGHRPG